VNFTPIKLTALFILVAVVSVCPQQLKPLTNNDVIRMVQEKVDEDLIMRAIRTSDTNFDVSPDGLIQLKKGKVKKQIIATIQEIQLRKNARMTSENKPSENIFSTRGGPAQVTPSSTPVPSPTPKPSPIATENSAFWRFDLEKCSHSGLVVICKFTITNLGEFRHLWIPERSLIDNNGNQVKDSDSIMGIKRDDEADIPEGVSISWSVTFGDVPPTALRISRLTLELYPGNKQPRTVIVFKDIPLTK